MINSNSDLKQFLDKFLNFKVAGKKVIIPYWMNKLDKEIYGPYGGKGTPEQILEATKKAAKEQGVYLTKLKGPGIHAFMKNSRIGLDCSGYAYQILNFLDLERGGDGLVNSVIGVKGEMGITKTNADALTNTTNSIPIDNLKDVKPGDMVRFNEGKHIMVIIEADEEQIEYTHISRFTKTDGPHLATIKLKDLSLGLENQEWEEKAKDGSNYKELFLRPNFGDGVRRLKILA